MSPELREWITWTLGTLTSISILGGIATRFILMPYLREHLIRPMQQVQKQVSENSHTNETPTILDRIDDVQEDVTEIRREMKAMASMYEGHLSWSERWVQLIEREIDLIKERYSFRRQDD